MTAFVMLSGSAIHAHATTIVIVTQSTEGRGINVMVERRINGGLWTPVRGKRTADGRMSAVEPVCDNTVEYRAADLFGLYVSSMESIIPCHEPEVVFEDFVPVFSGTWASDDSLTNVDTWTQVFGDGEPQARTAREAVAAIGAARSKGEYGQVAIMASELAAQLYAAGNGKSAAYMRALAIDATTRGAVVALGDTPATVETLVADPSGYLVMSPVAQDKIKQFQLNVLGAEPSSPSLGKIDWKTMRSLEGGTANGAAAWQLPAEALAKFDVAPLTRG
jgi:hypothetical protein